MSAQQQQQQQNNQGSGPAKGAAGSGAKKKDSPLRRKAKAAFDSSAPSISSDKFFNDYVEVRRNNVDIEFDPTVVDRLSAGYVKQADDYANYLGYGEDNHDMQLEAHSLISMTVSRKLMLASPQTEVSDVALVKDIMNHDLFVPKNLAAVVSNIGKFEQDDFLARIKYSTQDLFRILLQMCKNMDGHSQFHGLYQSPVWNYDELGSYENVPWPDVDPSKIVMPVESSTRWIRDQARDFLDTVYEFDWPLNDDDGNELRVSYPRLKVVNDPDRQLSNVTAWIAKLSPAHPHIAKVVSAGLCTAWKTFWTGQRDVPINQLIPGLPEHNYLTITPEEVLANFDVHIWAPNRVIGSSGIDTISMIRNVHSFIKDRQAVFARYLDLVRMPDDKFGTEAQMLALDPHDFVKRPLVGLPGQEYFQQKFESQSYVISKFKNKGRVVAGLAVGLSTKVEVKNNYLARLNGNSETILRSILAPDYKRNF